MSSPTGSGVRMNDKQHRGRGARAKVKVTRWGTPLTAFLLTTAWARPGWADDWTAFGAGARSVAMAGSGAALLDDPSALFACPAGMAFGRSSVVAGFVGVVNRLRIEHAPRPSGYDPPDLGAASPVIPYKYRLTARPSETRAPGLLGFEVGATASLGIDWLRLGVLAFVPVSGLGRQYTYFADEREQYFSNSVQHEIYGEQLASQQTIVAGAVRPLTWLSLSMGLRMSFAANSSAHVLVPDPVDQSAQQMDLRTQASIIVAPIFSIATRVFDERLRLAMTFRDELRSTIEGTNVVQVKGFQNTAQYPFNQPMSFVVEFVPRQLVFGGAWRTNRVGASADLIFSQWSTYRDNHNESAGFRNTWTAAAGGEVLIARRMWARAGLGYRPSPVPPQTGRTNYVDNDMAMIGLGAAREIDIDGHQLEVGLFGQLQLAVPRETAKTPLSQYPACAPGVKTLCDEVPDDTRDPATGRVIPQAAGLQTGNPGFPGFSSGGWIGLVGVQLTWRYQ